MSIKVIDDNKITLIGNAIRAKAGTQALIDIDDMPTAIADLPSGGGGVFSIYEAATHTYGAPNGIALYDEDVDNVINAAFQYSNYITSIDFPNCQGVGQYAFHYMNNVETIKIGKIGYSSSYQFNASAFQNCPKLKKIDLSLRANVSTNWESQIFYGCNSLEALILRNKWNNSMLTLGNSNALNGSTILNGNGYVYVDRSLLETYKQASNWSTVENKIRAIEDYPDVCD